MGPDEGKAFGPTDASFPRPLDWLGRVGEVAPLDRAPAGVPAPPPVSVRPAAEPPSAATPCAAGACSCGKGTPRGAGRPGPEVVDGDAAVHARARATAARMAQLGELLGLTSPSSPGALPDADAGAPVRVAAPPPRGKVNGRPGSGLPARPIVRVLVWARRVSQVVFLALFLYLLAQTAFRGSFAASADAPVRLPLPVEAFLLADPFVAAMTLLSTHSVYRGLAWSLVVVALTLVFGRVFCGWICPFGTLHHAFAWIFPSRYGKGNRRVVSNLTHVRQRAKYYLLYAFLASAALGSAIGGLFDPICVAVRAVGLAVIPAAQYAGQVATSGLRDTNVKELQGAADAAQDFLAQAVWQSKQFYFHQTWLLGILLLGVLFLNRFVPRFWCRVLCPLGAFLGLFSRFALFGMEKDHAKCTDCNLCLVHCQGADSPQGGVKWRQDECHMCLNCEVACPEDVIKFRFLPRRESTVVTPDLTRRTTLASAAAGAAFIPAARIADVTDVNYDARVIRPPGSVEEREFLERCIRCAECMKVCPNNALHPAFFEAGVEGLWTPILIARIGYCEHSCVLCGQVCPTGAIQKITEKEKLGIGQKPISIGTAFYDLGRCLPWAMATPCIVCEEFCPTSPKAIWTEEVDVPRRLPTPGADGAHPEMTTVRVQRPYVDPSLCIGCGACEKVCPVQDEPAVYVTNIGETRSKTNKILLEDTNYNLKG